jgi:hypothetical protein
MGAVSAGGRFFLAFSYGARENPPLARICARIVRRCFEKAMLPSTF